MTPLDPIFDALSDPTRRMILRRMSAGDLLTASGLACELPMTRQAVAKHLGVLNRAGLVEGERVGREMRYRFAPQPLGDAAMWIAEVGAGWDQRLDRLADLLADRRDTDR